MSELQLGLLVLGGVVIAGILAFNWLQERSHRKRADQAFDTPPRDILMESPLEPDVPLAPPAPSTPSFLDDPIPILDEPVAAAPPPEPTIAAERAPNPPRAAEAAPEPLIDYEATFEREETFDQAFVDRLYQTIDAIPRPIRLSGFDERMHQWVPLDEQAGGRFQRIQGALQLVDRQALVTREELVEFSTAMHTLAHDLALAVEMPSLDEIEARAQVVDAFCAEVDIAIGLSVVARTGQVFQGTTIRALSESAGLKLKPDGQFHFEDAQGVAQFTLDNQDPEPFFSDTIKNLTTTGVTFLLDVPRASGGLSAFDRMVQMTKKFSATLDGIIVDDNRQPLNDNGLDAIRRHLATVYAKMELAGMPAGGPVAVRLFS
ncbi:MAG: cell division protein ZipA C-terminal FtsZ-binding domain-containing protein [Burkholderiales bacterium]